MFQTAYNVSNEPVVIDDEGRMLGAHEWGTVDGEAEQVKSAIRNGQLHVATRPSSDEGMAEEAIRAFNETDKRNKPAPKSKERSE